MIPASSGCKRDAAFFGRKAMFKLLYTSVNEVGWTVALSKKRITFFLFFLIWKLKELRTFDFDFATGLE